jgi:hypothetical protein
MKIVLGTLARSGIEAFLGGDIAAGVQAALGHYAGSGARDELAPGRRALPCPPEHPPSRVGAELELTLDPEVEAALERGARESGGMSTSQVVAHAVLAYLADLDRASGLGARPLTQV